MKKLLLQLFSIAIAGTLHAAPGLDAPQAIGAYLNGVFPTTTPGPSGTWGLSEAFPNLTFIDPVKLVKDPLSTTSVYVVCRNGEIWKIPFTSSATTAQKVRFLDKKANTWGYWDTGMLSMAFHPEFGVPGSPNRGYVYVFYQYVPTQPTNPTTSSPSYMRLSRFTLADGATTINASTEYVMIQQYDRDNWHSGGQMFFAPDGFLHVIIGDEGAANDSHNQTQKINDRIFSGIMRIDVDNNPAKSHPIRRQPNQITMPAGWPQSFTQGYMIPNDNPWLDPNGTILEEFWTVGTRSPYSMHFDKATGNIWVAEVGQGTREEITIAKRGGNHQWPYREGLTGGPKAKPATIIGEENPPVYDYGRSMGGCIIGGFVYRGSQHSGSLTGKYLFGDHNTKAIYALNRPEGGEASAEYLTSVNRSGGDKRGLSGICEGPDGEVYITELGDNGTNTGKIYKLVRTGEQIADPPQLLSQTGAFTNPANLTPRQGLVPFGVNSPLWTDGSAKNRWIAIPNDGTHNTAAEQVTYSEMGAWTFPKGTVLVKHFALPVDERNPSIVKPVETRFFVHGSDGVYYGVTYKWNDAGTDAALMTGGGTRDFTITKQDGSTTTQRWNFPSRSDCRTCHSTSSDNVLGVRSHQLAGDSFYPLTGRTANQLETWNSLGIFGSSFGSRNPATLPRAVDPHDAHASLDHRVKSYLDANCSHCHHPEGVSANFDATFTTPLHAQGLVDGLINRPINGPTDRVVSPGNLASSLLHHRPSVVGTNQMPPLGKNVVDQKGVALIADWIRSLSADEFSASSSLGINAQYYNGRNFETLIHSRVEPQINFDWELASPHPGVNSDSFSAKWRGKIIAPTTGLYTFYATTDDGFLLKIGGVTVIGAWWDQPPTENTGTIQMTAGQAVDIEADYFENTGGAQAKLSWSGPGIAKQIIPPSAFSIDGLANHTPIATNDSFTALNGVSTPLNVLANDSDADAPIGIHGVAIVTPPTRGSIRIDGAAKRLIYQHNGSAFTNDSFTYTLTDPQGATSAPATVTLNIPFDFTAWSAMTPGAGGTATSNQDGDLYPDLLEFALGGSPASGAFPNGEPVSLHENSGVFSLAVKRPTALSGLTYQVLTSPDLVNWSVGPNPVVSPGPAGFEILTFGALEQAPGLSPDHGYVRLKVTNASPSTSAMTLPLGWLSAALPPGSRTIGIPFRPAPLFSSGVISMSGSKLLVHGTPPIPQGFVEVITGIHSGSTFPVVSVEPGEITVSGSPPDLSGQSVVLCENHTLGSVFDKNLLVGSTNPSSADQVQFYVNDGNTGRFELYYLLDARPNNAVHQWRAFLPGGGDQSGRIIAPGEGIFLKRPPGSATARLVLRGQVRGNPFSQPLKRGVNLVASPFPLDLTPRQRGLLNPAAGFKASTNINSADQFHIYQNNAFRVFYLLDHPTLPDPWRETVPGSPDYSDSPILKATDAVFLKRDIPSNSYVIPLPWNP
jgi:uncharacterized repeat protein (TIGR03806 family)